MGLDELKKTILDKANRKADLIVKAAYKEVEDKKRALEVEMDEEERRSDELVRRLIEQIENREIASASLIAKKERLLAKKQVIDAVFDKVKKDINRLLTKSQRKKLVESLIKKAESEINVGRIYCNKTDAEIVGKKAVQKDILGGIIAEDKNGQVVVDYSFETLIQDAKDKNIGEVTRILFG